MIVRNEGAVERGPLCNVAKPILKLLNHLQYMSDINHPQIIAVSWVYNP